VLQFFSFLEVPHKILVYFMCVNITLQSIAIVPHKILVYFMCVNIAIDCNVILTHMKYTRILQCHCNAMSLQSMAIENGTEEGTTPIESEISLACKFFFFCL